jgi:hypothetical protein
VPDGDIRFFLQSLAQQKATQEPVESQGTSGNAGTIDLLQEVTPVWFDMNGHIPA